MSCFIESVPSAGATFGGGRGGVILCTPLAAATIHGVVFVIRVVVVIIVREGVDRDIVVEHEAGTDAADKRASREDSVRGASEEAREAWEREMGRRSGRVG